MPTKEKFEELKARGSLPSPKGVALQVIRLSQQEDASNEEIAHAIKADPALAGRIIKAANSLTRNNARPVVSVVDAVTVLGMNTVRQLVLTLSLVDNHRSGLCDGFDYQAFWSRSLLTAIVAQKLVLRSGLGAPEEVFVLGLLVNIGSLALATAYPREYGKLLETCVGNTAADLARCEREEFELDHNQMTREMLLEWGMPRIFQEVALYHTDPQGSNFAEGGRDWLLLNVLHIADYFSVVCMADELRRDGMVPKLAFKATRMGVEANRLIELGDLSVREWQDWSKVFGIRTVPIPSLSVLLDAAPLVPDVGDVGHLPKGQGEFFKLRVLLVEDDKALLLAVRMLLENAGHTVAVARNGVEAMRQIEEFDPQLVITDWDMPKMDGIAFCKELRRNQAWRNTYVIIVAPHDGTDRLVEAFEAGANDFIAKPVTPKVLGARLGAGQRMVQLQEDLEFEHQKMSKLAAELEISNRRLQELALTDALTGLPNRRFANEHLEREWAGAERSGHPLSCMMVDIDYFKQVNDVHGHKTGDNALKRIAETLSMSIRKQDVVCRLGGEEFLVTCTDTSAEQAYRYAERLRLGVAATEIHSDDGKVFKLTISIGLATKKPTLLNEEMLLQLADKHLYAAKNGGRNRTVGD